MYTIVLLESEQTYVSSAVCSNTLLATYSFLSNSMPLFTSLGFFTKPCIIYGIQSTAFLPRTLGKVGTSLQPRNSSPSFSTIISNIFLARFLASSSCGKKNMPIPYSLSLPILIPSGLTAFSKNL